MNTNEIPSIVGPVQASHGPMKPEWLKIQDAVKVFGLSRSLLYELMAEGSIKNVSIRRRGNVRGRRLIFYDSLAAYIEGFLPDDESGTYPRG